MRKFKVTVKVMGGKRNAVRTNVGRCPKCGFSWWDCICRD